MLIDKKIAIIASLASIFLFTMVVIFLFLPERAFAAAIEPAYKVLQTQDSGIGASIKAINKNIIDFINGFAIILLIVVAFSEILRFNINTYGVKKILPALILAIIGANFSYLFCRLVVDFANVVLGALISTSSSTDSLVGIFGKDNWASAEKMKVAEAVKEGQWGVILWFVFAQLLVFGAGVLIYILSFLFFIRLWVIYFLVAIAPLAIMATVLPQTKNLFGQWWSNFSKWVFMPVVSIFWIWLGAQWVNNISIGDAKTAFVISYVFAGVCFYFAITTPFKMGGSIMNTWSSLGKKVTAPIGNFAKDQAALWWARQGASSNKLNALGHIARANYALKDMRKFTQEKTEDFRNKGMASMMDTKLHGNRTVARERFGGDIDMAKAKILNRYLKTKAGEDWAKGRAEWMTELNTENAEKEKAFAKGSAEFRTTDKGKAFAERMLKASKQKELQDLIIKIADKELISTFNSQKGVFAPNSDGTPTENSQLVSDYFAALVRDKTMDETVSRTSSKAVETILEDQVFIENIKSKIEDLDGALDSLAKKQERYAELRGKQNLTKKERAELKSLNKERADWANQEMQIKTDRRDMVTAAIKKVQDAQAAGKHHLDGFVDPSDNKEPIKGFAGSLNTGDHEFDKKLGTIMMTRAGKLMSIEIKADADKILDRATITEIANELQHGNAANKMLGYDAQAVDNFRNGKQYLNAPSANRDIEAHMIALSKVARQNNHPESSAARIGLVSMLNDNAAKQAAAQFNEFAKQLNIQDRINPNQSTADLQEAFVSFMGSGNKAGKAAFAAVTNQKNVGLSDNPSAYLSTGGSGKNGYGGGTTIIQSDREPLRKNVTAVALAGGSLNKALASNPEIVSQLGEIKGVLQSTRNNMAKEIGRQFGLNMQDRHVREIFTAALRSVPGKGDQSQALAHLNNLAVSLGGQAANPSQAITVQMPGGQPRQFDLGKAINRHNVAAGGVESADLISMKPQVDRIANLMQHFGGRSSAGADFKALSDQLSLVESPKTQPEDIERIVNEAARKVGIGTATDINFPNKDAAIDFLKRLRDAASFSSQAGAGGQFDLDKASEIAAKHYTKQPSKNPENLN